MDLTSTQTISPTTALTATPQTPPAVLNSDFETFLRMLTTQAQNQDPFNPVDATEYASQLATFSSVEQQVKTNQILAGLAEQVTGSAFERIAGWIGMEALVDTPVRFEGVPVTLRLDPHKEAESAKLVVRNEAGTVLQSVAVDLSKPELEWTGLDESGAAHPSGLYRFEIESYRGEELLSTTPALTYARVQEVRQQGTDVLLTLANGTHLSAAEVQGLRTPNG
ncbi:flagellar hook capping FlgD N-terminal domain-containing protein [Salipiger marinus]|uniref:Basal-body rod modification protein FlgD n=1 Tax=Salipiger marinus TaxID=555512 RepID=A0A1G8IDY7_9RHOB|nr:flagellar hook capping FlgD N-terminal domain-containing protein [Salipiger marinus]SDI17072.1 flagellar basal-body rod modification protein FlgD [Salipiger marinus]